MTSSDPVADVAYPAEWEADILLSDGGTAHLRPIRPDDGPLLVDFHSRQSPESVYFRFFSPRPRLSDRQVEQLVNVDYRNRMAFVVLEGEQLIAVARYEPVDTGDRSQVEAEVAFFVDDDHNGRGLATILLEYLAAAARQMGRRRLIATVLPENQKMLKVFRAVGFEVKTRFSDGYIAVTLDIESDDAGLGAIASRERLAEARSVDRFVAPQSVAVVGGSRPGSVGFEIVRHIVDGGFTGSVFPVNLSGTSVHDQPGFTSIEAIGQQVDIAVVAVPQPDVDNVLDDCIASDVGGVVITSAGYSEAGPNGLRAERDLVAKALRNGLRVLGPNCLGVINTAEGVRLNGSLIEALPSTGSIAVSTQSGALGRLLVQGLARRGLGVSQFVALGNKADVSGNDLLQFWELDDRTEIVLMHLESLGNPIRFQRIARSVSAKKPVIALIPAGDDGGLPATEPAGDEQPGHESSESAGSPDSTESSESVWTQVHWPAGATLAARVEQAGVVAVESFAELLDGAAVLGSQPVPAGPHVLLVGNSGAALRLAAGEAHRHGLRLANLVERQGAALARQLPPAARLENPVDLTYAGEPEDYGRLLDQLESYQQVESIIVVHAPPLPGPTDSLLEQLNAVSARLAEKGRPVTLVACIPDFEESGVVAEGETGAGDVPVFQSIHAGVRAVSVAVRYGQRLAGDPPPESDEPSESRSDNPSENHSDNPSDNHDELGESVRQPIERLLASSDHVLSAASAQVESEAIVDFLRAGGLRPVDRRFVASEDEAVDAAKSIGYPVVLKAGQRGPLARSQYTGVALDLADETALRASYRRMSSGLGSAMDTAEIQAMASAGIDAAVSVHRSSERGTVVTLGRGGAGATPIDNRPVAMLPLDERQAERLVEESELGPVLDEIIGSRQALIADLVRLAALVEASPELVELRLNPVLIGAAGVAVTDVEIVVAEPPTVAPRVRRLR